MKNEPIQNSKADKENFFNKAAFDVEHALSMHAVSFCTLPAEAIYDKDTLAQLSSVIETCHIYLIGYTPKIELISAEQKSNQLLLTFDVLRQNHIISYDIPEGFSLIQNDGSWFLINAQGQRCVPDGIDVQSKLSSVSRAVTFEVKYVGQAYGQGGSRNAIDRLLKHETLQKIALTPVPDGYSITLLLLSVQPSNRLVTVMNPFAKNTTDGSERIKQGLRKLFNTTEEERISLYEAALIRYFYPDFNKEFKDSFPSTNLKILRDCYEKDFSAVVAEIFFDDLPFQLWSKSVDPAFNHIAKHALHKDEDRRVFFGL